MPNKEIEEYRKKLIGSPEIKIANRQANLNKHKEEMKMNGLNTGMPLPNMLGAGVGVPTPMGGGMGVPTSPTQMENSPNLRRVEQSALREGALRGLSVRPLGLVTDGNEIHTFKYDTTIPELKQHIEEWQLENRKTDKNGVEGPRKYSDIRAVKDYCIKTGADPAQFVKTGDDGKPELNLKRPVVKGMILRFPSTEGGEVTEIVKKAELQNALYKHNVFNVAGTTKVESINPEKLELPISLHVLPSTRETKSGKKTHILRTGAQMNKDLQKSAYPDKKNVSMLDMFKIFPTGQYKYVRVVPLKVYQTKMVEGKPVGIIDINNKESKLTQYASTLNDLSQDAFGKGLMGDLGISAQALEATFSRKTTSTDSEQDLINMILEGYTGSKADSSLQDKHVNTFLHNMQL